ncbi:MAG TPA: DUF4185 domain-containing protein [Planctomycetota bacterium]|nr:DUF4185 domain-containing protein [Planctomycetota bacterium]
MISSCVSAEQETLPMWVPGSTRPIVQLSGEKFQYFHGGKVHVWDTAGMSLTNCDMNGTDLGVPVSFPGKIVLLFGDSWPYVKKNGKWTWYPTWGKGDSVGYIEKPVEFSMWDCLERLDAELSSNASAQPDYSRGPLMKFYLKEKSKENEPRYWETEIKNLTPGQALGPFEVPTGAFAMNGHIYMFYNVKHQEEHLKDGKRKTLFLNSILARTEKTHEHWKENAPPVFTRLYDVGEQSRVKDITDLPDDTKGAAKFIHVAPVLLDAEAVKTAGFAEELPAELRGRSVVLMWGASWKYVHSNLYLAVVAADEIEAGISKWWYFEGLKDNKASWTRDEKLAAPLIHKWPKEPCIGEHSVKWNADLKAYVLTYQEEYRQIMIRFAAKPWGEWSESVKIFGHHDPWAKFVHHKDRETISSNTVEVFKPNGEPFTVGGEWGATYGPYMFDEYTKNADGSVTIYFTMSTWVPYQVFLMKTTVKK